MQQLHKTTITNVQYKHSLKHLLFSDALLAGNINLLVNKWVSSSPRASHSWLYPTVSFFCPTTMFECLGIPSGIFPVYFFLVSRLITQSPVLGVFLLFIFTNKPAAPFGLLVFYVKWGRACVFYCRKCEMFRIWVGREHCACKYKRPRPQGALYTVTLVADDPQLK